MRNFPVFLFFLLLAAGCSAEGERDRPADPHPQAGFGDAEPGGPYAAVELIAPDGLAAPGDTTWVGLVFTMEPGWFIYWNGLNDSGLPPSVKWTLPQGATAGELLWPRPQRKISPGNILDHVYTKQAVLACPIVHDGRHSGNFMIEAKVEWLVCNEACVAESSRVSLDLESGGTSSPGSDITIMATLADQPTPLPSHVHSAWEDNSLRVEAGGAESLRFLPFADCALPRSLYSQGQADGSILIIEFEASSLDQGVHGILEIQQNGALSRYVLDTR